MSHKSCCQNNPPKTLENNAVFSFWGGENVWLIPPPCCNSIERVLDVMVMNTLGLAQGFHCGAEAWEYTARAFSRLQFMSLSHLRLIVPTVANNPSNGPYGCLPFLPLASVLDSLLLAASLFMRVSTFSLYLNKILTLGPLAEGPRMTLSQSHWVNYIREPNEYDNARRPGTQPMWCNAFWSDDGVWGHCANILKAA